MTVMDGEDLTGVMWNDRQWLSFFPLNESTVLDYFSLSPFYDRACNNEIVKMQRLDPALMATMEGIEYTMLPSTSPLFLIGKSRRTISPKATVKLLSVYYVVNGNVYQAPSAQAVLSSRVLQSLHHLRQSFDVMQRHAIPGPIPSNSEIHWHPSPCTGKSTASEISNQNTTRPDASSLEKKAIDRILYDILDKNRRIAAAAAASNAAKGEMPKSSS